MKIYVAGPMSGIPNFNFPLFDAVTKFFRGYSHEVFNPAERDNERHGVNISADNAEGSIEKAAAQHGFSLRQALEDDTRWICQNAEAIALLPGWEKSKGANAEKALAEALGVQVFYVVPDDTGNFALFKDYTFSVSKLK